jgi:AraC-like DNA-binding protein
MVSVGDYITLVGNIATKGTDPAYHLALITRGMPIHRPGLDLGLRYAPTLEAALKLFVRFEPNRRKYNALKLRTDSENAILKFEALTDLGPARPVLVETNLISAFQVVSRNRFWESETAKVTFQHNSAHYCERLRALFGCQIAFDAEADELIFPASWLDTPNPAFDPVIWQTALNRCALEDLDASREGLGYQVWTKVALNVEQQASVPLAEELAAELGMSERTFVRRLKSVGLTYRTIFEYYLRGRSRELLADPDASIADVAERLGFSDSSSFHRSFRRWNGVSPAVYRKAVAERNASWR